MLNSDLGWLNPVKWWTDDITFHWESYVNFAVKAFATLGFDLVIGDTSYFGLALTAKAQGFRGTPFASVLWVDPSQYQEPAEMFCH